MTENWYLVLGLEFDPNPVVDEKVIEQKIEEKRKFWARNANDLMHGPEYRKYTQMLPTIRKDMIGEENIRQELIRNAICQAYEPVDEILQEIGKKEITEEMVERMAKKLDSSTSIVKQRAKLQGIAISQKEVDDQELYEKYYKEKPKNTDKYNTMKTQLMAFNVDNLYEFLFPKKDWMETRKNPTKTLLTAAQEKKKTEFYKNDSLSGTGSKLCVQCEEIFANTMSKKEYDNVLEYNERKMIFDRAKEICEITGEVSVEAYTKAVGELSKIIRPEEAEEAFRAFCRIERLPVQVSSQSTMNQNQHKEEPRTWKQAEAAQETRKKQEEYKEYESRNTEQKTGTRKRKRKGGLKKLIIWGVIGGVIWNVAGKDLVDNNKDKQDKRPSATVTVPAGSEVNNKDGSNTNKSTNTNKDSTPAPNKSIVNKNTPTNKPTNRPTSKPTNTTSPVPTLSQDKTELVKESMEEFLELVQVVNGEYENISVKSEFVNELKTLRQQAEKLEDGVFTMEENTFCYSTIAILAENYDYDGITVEMKEDDSANCKVTISYSDFSRVTVLARMLTAEKTKGEEDISDSKWNKLYLESLKEAAKDKKTQRKEEITFYLEYSGREWKVSGCNDNKKAYNALAGGTLRKLDYEWLEKYEKEKK